MRHAFPVRRRRSFLASLRSPFIGWLQVITALLWIMLPTPVVNSYWHDTDYDGIPEFYSDPPSPWETEDADSDGLTNGEESTFGSSPFLQDSDYDGLLDVQEYTISQALGSNLNPWDPDSDDDGIFDNSDNDPLIPLDSDGDGMPNNVDPYPYDPTNDTSWWDGGQFWIDAIFATIGTTPYSTSDGLRDSDADGIIDAADPYDYDPYNNTAWWNGGTFRINAVEQTFGYMPFTISSGTGDSDYDGIPDGLDPFVSDSSNNSLWWEGNYYVIDGDSQRWITSAWTTYGDSDSDGIPNALDPYPNDPNNNSIWLEGFYYWLDGTYTMFGSGWYSASSGNADGDSLPDVLDPHPNDPTNNTSFWYGGTFWVDGSLTMMMYPDPFAWATSDGMFDADADGIYDSVDPYLNNAANNTAFWQGGTFWIDGNQQSFSADVHGYNASYGIQDSDFDGIPDSADPYANDTANNTGTWGGGAFRIAGQLVEFGETRFNYSANLNWWEDYDGDGIPNMFDPYGSDPTNYTIGFGGGSYVINGSMTELEAGYVAGAYADNDGDGIPDYFDPHPWDNTNNSSYWNGNSWWVDGVYQSFYSNYYATSAYADSDWDGLPDFWDPHVNDSSNNTSWWSGVFYSDGIEHNYSQYAYASSSGTGDADGDGIPDGMDTYRNDSSNNTAYWGGGTWWINGQEHTWATTTPYAANADAGDSDGDGIINVLDPYPNDPNNNTATFTGGSFHINGILNEFGHYFYSADIGDADDDGIPDFLDPYIDDITNNTSAWAGDYFYIDGSLTFLSGYRATTGDYDTDDDGIPDAHDPYPNDSGNNTSIWNGDYFYIDGNHTFLSGYRAATGDYDADDDGIPNAYDPYPNDPDNNTAWWTGGTFIIDGIPQQLSPTYAYDALQGFPDLDGDHIPDAVDPYYRDLYNDLEGWHEFILSLNPFDEEGTWEENITVNEWLDAWFLQNPEQRTSKPKYLDATEMTDSDGDSIPDALEEFFALDKFDPEDASLDPNNTGWSNLERYLAGQDLRNPLDPLQNWNSDAIPNVWKIRYGFDLFDLDLGYADPDEDGMANLMEYLQGTNPVVPDGGEDADGDGLNEAQELLLGTNPQAADTDENGVADGDEDYDHDGLSNALELSLGTNPLIADTDGDGSNDGDENNNGSDPKSPDDEPELIDPSTPVVTEVRWIKSAWEENGGTYHHLYWMWNWTSPTEGGWTTIGGGDDELPSTKVGFATYSDGRNQEQFSDIGSTMSSITQVSSNENWVVEGGISVDSTFNENLNPGMPPISPTHTPEYPNTDTYEATWTDEVTRSWHGGAMEMRLAWSESASSEAQKPVKMHFLKIQKTNGEINQITPHVLNLQPGAEGSNSTISISASTSTPGVTVEESVVPLDIYIVHPVTGELPEYMEDSNSESYHESGKGGLIALRRTENTPMTKLVLRPIGGLDSGARQRIKFTSAMFNGKINVWSDPDRTQAVISQQTEFPANETTTLFLEGEEVSLTGDVQITQQVSSNGSWVDGDSVSTIVVHAEIPVVLRCFIPHKWTAGEAPIPVDMTFHLLPPHYRFVFSNTVGGNRQNYSMQGFDDEPEFKLAQQVIMTPYKELHATADLEQERDKKKTHSSDFYKRSEDVPASDQGLNFGEAFVPGATPNWTFAPPDPEDQYENSGRSGKKTYLTASLSGEVGAPRLIPSFTIPNIDFKYEIEMERMETGGAPYIRVQVKATCNRYPAYEALVENSDGEYQQLYKVKPNDSTLPGAISLNRSFTEQGEQVDIR